MPFITDGTRKVLDPLIEPLLSYPFTSSELSYVLLKIITSATTRDVASVITMMGILEDVKATYRKYRYDNLEERVLFERWLVRDGDY